MFNLRVLCLLGLALTIVTANGLPRKGGVKELSGEKLEEAEQILRESLTKLAAGEGPNYRLSKIISATSQVVSGSLHKFNVELIDKNNAIKKCNVIIWSQPWLDNGIEVTFECDGENKLVKKHSV